MSIWQLRLDSGPTQSSTSTCRAARSPLGPLEMHLHEGLPTTGLRFMDRSPGRSSAFADLIRRVGGCHRSVSSSCCSALDAWCEWTVSNCPEPQRISKYCEPSSCL